VDVLRAALIDVGGTLWPELGPPSDQQERRLQELLGLDEHQASQLADALNRSVSPWESPLVLEQDTDALIGDVLRRLRVTNVDRRAVRQAMCVPASNGATLFPEAPQLLRTIADHGSRTVLVNNTAWRDADDYRRDFEFFDVSDQIHSIIASLDVGFRKPHQAIFRVAIAAAECTAPECVFLGDSEEKDIAPAVAHGMRSILVAIERPPPAETAAQRIATSLREARDILGQWMA
jgi:FMN phosphatase YigB (HAD superfamily)